MEDQDEGGPDSIGQFRDDKDKILGQEKREKTGLDVVTDEEREQQSLSDAQPHISLNLSDFITVLDQSSASSKKDIINTSTSAYSKIHENHLKLNQMLILPYFAPPHRH